MSGTTRLVAATTNPGKLREFRSILPPHIQLHPLSDFSSVSPEESGQTFLDNAMIKAEHACSVSGLPAIADDSGLAVDALQGRPGVHSARFAGPDATDEDNNRKLIAELTRLNATNSSAQFVSVVAFCAPDGFRIPGRGMVHGRIVFQPRGEHGFGYDPHFELDDPNAGHLNGRTMAELTLEQKSSVSHRRRALDDLMLQVRTASNDHPLLKHLFED